MSFEESLEKWKNQLVEIYDAGVRAVQPSSIVDKYVSVVDDEMKIHDKSYKINGNVYLVGFGKAVMGMAATMERKLGDRLKRGIVSVPRGAKDTYYRCMEKSMNYTNLPNFSGPIDYREGSTNNQPDEDALITSHDIIDLAESLGENDTLIVLISGGGSALFYMPRPTIESESKLRFCKKLQNSGASIKELNVVRQKLSMVKGGGLALMAYPAKVVTLILSDIVGDPTELVASGPTVHSEKSAELVASILRKYNLYDKVDGDLKNLVILKEAKIDEKKFLNEKKEFRHVDNYVIGNNALATKAASEEAARRGFSPIVLCNDVVGDVRDVSKAYARLASLVCSAWSKNIERKDFFDAINKDKVFKLPAIRIDEIFESLENSAGSGIVLIAGGEPEVSVKGDGLGGRNQELALSFSLDFFSEVKKDPRLTNYEVIFLSAGTDGQDGPTDATGAFGYPAIEPIVNVLLKKLQKISTEKLLSREISDNSQKYTDSDISSKLSVANKIVPQNALENNDSYNFYSRFRKGKDLLKTGITGTNVMDLHFLLVRKRECACDLDFEKKEYCPDPLEEHDLHEDVKDIEERERLLRLDEKIDEERKLLNLKILDSSLMKYCCEKKSK